MKIFTDENQLCSNLRKTKDNTKMYIDKYLLSQPVCDYWNNILEQIWNFRERLTGMVRIGNNFKLA